jgi:hypothetical protein
MCNATVLFGDDSANQSYYTIMAGSPAFVPHNYSAIGTYTITVIPSANKLSGLTYSVNTFTVTVTAYTGNYI